MPISPTFVTRFLQLVTERSFAEASRVLERLRERVEENEWNRGYLQALEGMLLAQRSKEDPYAFIPNLELADRKEIGKHRQEFLSYAKDRLHADYDRGFFSAWAEYMRVMARVRPGRSTEPKKKS